METESFVFLNVHESELAHVWRLVILFVIFFWCFFRLRFFIGVILRLVGSRGFNL